MIKYFKNNILSKKEIVKIGLKFFDDIRKNVPYAKNAKNAFTVNGEPILSVKQIPKHDKVIFVCKLF